MAPALSVPGHPGIPHSSRQHRLVSSSLVSSSMVRCLSLGGFLLLISHTVALPQQAERLSLKDAIEIALQRNPEVQSARHGVTAARGRFWQGVSLPPPSLSLSYDYIPTGSGIKDYGERVIGISQSFDFPTTIGLRASSLSYETDATEADFRTASLAVTMQVKEAYFGVLAAQQKLKLAEENLAIADDFARKADIRYNVGEGTHLESLTAKVQLTQSRNAVDVARNDLRLAAGGLSYVLGRREEVPGGESILTDSLTYRPITVPFESLIEQARQSNSRLEAAAFRLSAASANRAIAWSSILPSFNVSYSRQAQVGNSSLYGVSFGMSLPIWFLFDQRGQVQEATAVHARLESELQMIENFITLDVKNAFLEFKNDERQVQLFQSDLLPQAEEVYRGAATSYEAGEITYIEFLQARQTLIAARSTYIDALYHYNTAIARLEKMVGRTIGG